MTHDLTAQRLTELADRLAAATSGRSAQWELDGDDVFVWRVAEGSVTVGSRDRDGEPPYELIVRSPTGETVDELTSELLGAINPHRGTMRSSSSTGRHDAALYGRTTSSTR